MENVSIVKNYIAPLTAPDIISAGVVLYSFPPFTHSPPTI